MRNLMLLTLVACATSSTPSSKGGPRGLRASDHLAAARAHDEVARDYQTSWPTTQVMTPGSTDPSVQMPWLTSRDTTEHALLARTHRSQAAALHVAYEEACGERSGTDVTGSPLAGLGGTAWNTATGVVIYLDAPVGTADKVLATLRCHRAWIMLGPAGPDDVLDLPGLVLGARDSANGVTLSLTVTDPKLIPELQRRVAKQLETRSSARL